MLLSGFNLIKHKSCGNHEFSDFILGKIKEEQEWRDKKCLGEIPYPPKHKKIEKSTENVYIQDPDVQKENINNENILQTTGEVVKQRVSSSKCEEVSHVSIETKDGYYLSINRDRNILHLSEEEQPSKSSIFCQRMFKVKSGGENDKTQHLVAFQLQCDQSRFITTTDERKLDVMKYADRSVNPECPDERFFILHKLDGGSVFLQPYAHKGYYLHHIDNNLYVRKLEINWRPPEEYFFRIEMVDLPEPEVERQVSGTSQNRSELNKQTQNLKNRHMIDVKLPETPKPSLIFGCFGSKAKKIRISKKNKR